MGWLSLGLGCLWDWAQNALAIRYLLRSWPGRGILLLYWGAWGFAAWWVFHGLAWYWALLCAALLWLAGNVGAGIYALRELQQSKSYQAASEWVAGHPWLGRLTRRNKA